MTTLCGFLADAPGPEAPGTDAGARATIEAMVDAMTEASRARPGQVPMRWRVGPLALGLLARPEDVGRGPGESASVRAAEALAAAVTPDRRHHLWLAGEVVAVHGPAARVGDGGPGSSLGSPDRRRAFLRNLLDALVADGPGLAAGLDGDFQLVLFDVVEERLTLVLDRFAGLPLYTARVAPDHGTPAGLAFGSRVRGLLALPGVSRDPDPEALREAVSFGGFRLGGHTTVAAVSMLPGGAMLTARSGDGAEPRVERHWTFADLEPVAPRPVPELIDRAHDLWTDALGRRLPGGEDGPTDAQRDQRPGQTLSGGLDSRLILAEAVRRCRSWTALTYGVPGCDDERYARRAVAAALAAGGGTGAPSCAVHWTFLPLYAGRDPDWLERRRRLVRLTDGLVDLTDLMHVDSVALQAALLDLHLSGYAGDAVAGPTFHAVADAPGVLAHLPWYGGPLSMGWDEALGRAEELVAGLGGAPARFALFDHKLPQSTNRWGAAWRPWFPVRRPFLDHRLFDFFQGLAPEIRGEGRLYERWLLARYPELFATVANQKTGLPVGAPAWRHQLARGGRLARRVGRRAAERLGLEALVETLAGAPRRRAYTDDETAWRRPGTWERIRGTILRPGSVACEVFGRRTVTETVDGWHRDLSCATQVVGCLFAFEEHHRDLEEDPPAPPSADEAPSPGPSGVASSPGER